MYADENIMMSQMAKKLKCFIDENNINIMDVEPEFLVRGLSGHPADEDYYKKEDDEDGEDW